MMLSSGQDTVGIVEVTDRDPAFMLTDGYVIAGRAAIRISRDCPARLQQDLQQALAQGWIEPVAYMQRDEWTLAKLRGD